MVRVKFPDATASNLKEPASSVVAVRVDLEMVFSSVTKAPGIWAPSVSSTVPMMLPVGRGSADAMGKTGASGNLSAAVTGSVEGGIETDVVGIEELKGPE